MSDMYLGSQMPMYQNVRICCIDKKTGHTRVERLVKNRVTRLMLWGMAKFLAGEFNDSTPDKIYEYIPRYLALGSNTASASSTATDVKTIVTVDDTHLLNEYKVFTATGATEPVKRINIEGRQHNKTTTTFSEPFIKLSFRTYVNSSHYDELQIGEAGLFSKETGNNCLARVVFPPFTKKSGEVIDIQWDITLLSYGTTKYPNSISISGPSRVVIPLNYSPYFIKHVRTGLFYNSEAGTIINASNSVLFNVDNTGVISELTPQSVIKDDDWCKYIEQLDDSHISVSSIYDIMLQSKLVGDQIVFSTDKLANSPTHFYLGNAIRLAGTDSLLADSENYLLKDSDKFQLATSDPVPGSMSAREIYMSYIYRENRKYTYTDTGARIVFNTGTAGNYEVVDSDGDNDNYKIIEYQIYKKTNGEYKAEDAYISGGYIVDSNHIVLGYTYDVSTGIISKQEEVTPVEIQNTNTYIAYPSSAITRFNIYAFDNTGAPSDTGYYIMKDDGKIYNEGIYTEYHLTSDYYFAIGDAVKLNAVITPIDSTDNTITWSVSNNSIAIINQQGVITGWNLGETAVTVTTINGVKTRVTAEVVRNTAMVPIEEIVLSSTSITLNVRTDASKETIINARVVPVIASYNTIRWEADTDFLKIMKYEDIGNNQVKVALNGSENIGRGYITAVAQDGTSASCLVTVLYTDDTNPDCPDPSHEYITS